MSKASVRPVLCLVDAYAEGLDAPDGGRLSSNESGRACGFGYAPDAAAEAQPFTGLPITTKGKQSRRTSHEKVRNEVFMSSVQIDNNWQRIQISAEDFFPKLSGVF